MKKEQIFGIIRSLLTFVGSYLFGKNIFGNPIDESLWQEIVGAIMVVIAFAWTIGEKKLTLEILQSSILKVITVAGALLVSSGKLSSDNLNGIVAAITAILPVIYSLLSKKKSEQIESGEIKVDQLSGIGGGTGGTPKP